MLVREIRQNGLSSGIANNEIGFLAIIAASLVVQAWLISVQEFNWDEFYFLGFVHDYLRGDLSTALQTIHVHLFAPLAQLPGTEIDQLIVGRLTMLACEAVTLVALYKLWRTWTDRGPALFALCAYATIPATMQHGASFRTDPLALALTMTALACIARASPAWKPAAAIALLTALAALVTVKVILFAPAFAGIAVWRLAREERQGPIFRWLATIAILTPVLFLIFYFLHQASLPKGSIAGSSAMMEGAARKTLIETRMFPRSEVLFDNLLRAPVQFLFLVAGTVLLIGEMFRNAHRATTAAIIGCVAPMLCLVIYRNAFPYFIPFIVAPAFAVIAWLAQSRGWPANFQLVLTLIMAATAIPSVERIASRDQATQRAVIKSVHEIFPRPVVMIDHSHMISSFPKRGFFMSTWGLANYRVSKPIFGGILEREPVPLLLLDSPRLAEAVGARPPMGKNIGLLDEDRSVLARNFVPHWGPIWVAGQRIAISPQETSFEMLIPGTYTLEGLPARINGHQIAPGSTIRLDRGINRIAGRSEGIVTLRWGQRLARPAATPPAGPLFVGF